MIATHADDALALLTDADRGREAAARRFGYSTNVAWLHRDESVLPTPRAGAGQLELPARGLRRPSTDRSRVSYWMNRLQGHPERDPLVVTLNPDDGAAPGDVHRRR